MKIIHTADIHLGQVIYQNYDRSDEHRHFFAQLKKWCKDIKPDALIVSGDVFDIQQPSATVKKAFTDYFVDIHRECPEMRIVITAGNHDSASRIQADSAVWELAGTTLVGIAPNMGDEEGWEDKYIVDLGCGYVIAIPFMTGERKDMLQHLLDVVGERNVDGNPVVLMGHTAVTGLDISGHNIEIGTLRTQGLDSFGSGFDYLALGHIHKPQTIGHQEDAMKEKVSYPSPVARYSGSALHVSCDETYPHSVSLVEIDKHKGNVSIEQLRIDELRHFYVLPEDGAFDSTDAAIGAVKQFCDEHENGYFRLCVDISTDLPANFNQMVYDILSPTNEEIRYNPKIIWNGSKRTDSEERVKPTFEVADLQQMTNPMEFVEKIMDQYPSLDIEELRSAFIEVEDELHRMEQEKAADGKTNASKKQNIDNTDKETEE